MRHGGWTRGSRGAWALLLALEEGLGPAPEATPLPAGRHPGHRETVTCVSNIYKHDLACQVMAQGQEARSASRSAAREAR